MKRIAAYPNGRFRFGSMSASLASSFTFSSTVGFCPRRKRSSLRRGEQPKPGFAATLVPQARRLTPGVVFKAQRALFHHYFAPVAEEEITDEIGVVRHEIGAMRAEEEEPTVGG